MPNDTSTTPQQQIKIGLWGTRGSGKTTYILMLIQTLNSMHPDWFVAPVDEISSQWLRSSRERMNVQHEFVDKTRISAEYTFDLSQRDTKGQIVPRFQLKLYDEPGELYELRPIKPTEREDQSDIPPIIEQHSGADAPATKTPWGAFETLMNCDALLIMLDPGWSSNNLPYHSMIADLLSDIDSHILDAKMKNHNHPLKTPVIAFCLSKLEGGDLLGAFDLQPKDMWKYKEKQPNPDPSPAFNPSNTDSCFLFYDRPHLEKLPPPKDPPPPYHSCEKQCLVFHMLGKRFFEHHIRTYVRRGWEIACFPISSIGTLPKNSSKGGEVKRVIPSGAWQREHTPAPPTYHQLKHASNILNMIPTDDLQKNQAFYNPRLVETDEPYNTWELFAPIEWAYKRIAPSHENQTIS